MIRASGTRVSFIPILNIGHYDSLFMHLQLHTFLSLINRRLRHLGDAFSFGYDLALLERHEDIHRNGVSLDLG